MTDKIPTTVHTIDITGPGGAETVFLDIAQQLQMANYDNLAIGKDHSVISTIAFSGIL